MAEDQRINCPECGMFAAVRLAASGSVRTDLDGATQCRHRLIGTAILACSSFRPEIVAAHLRLRPQVTLNRQGVDSEKFSPA